MQKAHYPPLDGVRGVAIILVLMVHAFNYKGPALIGRGIESLARAGWVGVTLFFVLSGFLISGILLDTRGRRHYLRDFYARRSFRIFPLYFAFLAAYLFVVPHIPALGELLPQPAPRNRVLYWTYTANMKSALGVPDDGVPTLDPLWSLAVEEQVYLFWPFLILLVPRRRLPAVFVAAALGSMAWRFLTRLTAQSIEVSYAWTPANIEAFAAGALVAFYTRENSAALRTWAPRVAMMSGCFLLGMWVGQRHFNFWYAPVQVLTIGTTALIAFFAATVGVSVTSDERSAMNRALSASWLRSLGKFSYAMYLFHATIMHVMSPWFFSTRTGFVAKSSVLGGLLFTGLVGVLSYLAACLSWYAWESHFLRLKKFFPLSSNVVRAAGEPVVQPQGS